MAMHERTPAKAHSVALRTRISVLSLDHEGRQGREDPRHDRILLAGNSEGRPSGRSGRFVYGGALPPCFHKKGCSDAAPFTRIPRSRAYIVMRPRRRRLLTSGDLHGSWGIIGGLGIGGLLGTIGTQWATGRREKAARQMTFKKQQLEEFYGPLLAAHREIRARGELRVKLQQAVDAQHTEDMLDAGASGGAARHDRINAATDTHIPAIVTNIQEEGQTFRDVLMPRYRSMIDIFRDKMWLAEPETRDYFGQLRRVRRCLGQDTC